MQHREERELSITLHLSASFPEEYDGDDDGFAWHRDFEQRVRPEILRAVFEVLRREPGYQAIAAPRGRHPTEAIDIDVAVHPGRSPR